MEIGLWCDAYATHWDDAVLKCMEVLGIVGIMGVPNATGLWQYADIQHNKDLKAAWHVAKQTLLKRKAEDAMRPLIQQRIYNKADQNKLKPSDIFPLINMIFLAVHKDRLDVNLSTIAKTGVSPGTHVLLVHPEVVRTGKSKAESVQNVTDTALSAFGDGEINLEAVGVIEVREEADKKRANLNKQSMLNDIEDNGADIEGMTEEERALQRATDECTAKGGSIFLEAMRLGLPEGIEYTSDLIGGIASHTATTHLEAN